MEREKSMLPHKSRTAGPILMKTFCEFLSGFLDCLYSRLDQIGPTRGGSQTGILRFTLEVFVYKWLLLVIGEIISRN